MKTPMRQSALSGSERFKIDRLMLLGWHPGISPANLLRRGKRERPASGGVFNSSLGKGSV